MHFTLMQVLGTEKKLLEVFRCGRLFCLQTRHDMLTHDMLTHCPPVLSADINSLEPD